MAPTFERSLCDRSAPADEIKARWADVDQTGVAGRRHCTPAPPPSLYSATLCSGCDCTVTVAVTCTSSLLKGACMLTRGQATAAHTYTENNSPVPTIVEAICDTYQCGTQHARHGTARHGTARTRTRTRTRMRTRTCTRMQVPKRSRPALPRDRTSSALSRSVCGHVWTYVWGWHLDMCVGMASRHVSP